MMKLLMKIAIVILMMLVVVSGNIMIEKFDDMLKKILFL